MTAIMDEHRFTALAEAWGGDLRRWPGEERAAAEAFRAAGPERAALLLDDADAVDALLHASKVSPPSAAFRERVIALAEKAGLTPRRPMLQRASTWLSGAGWAAACAAGVLAGAQATASVASDIQADSVLYQASLSTLDEQEVLG